MKTIMKMADKNNFYIFNYWKTIIFSVIILILCFLPQNNIPNSKINIPHFDKILHFGVYFILAIIMSFELRKKKTSKVLLVLLYCLILGCFIEIIQNYLIASRSGDLLDLIADIGGSIVGIVIFKIIKKKISIRKGYFL